MFETQRSPASALTETGFESIAAEAAARFRSGLYAAARLDGVSVRGLPDGRVRITIIGDWSGVLRG
jgi:hypothetical protein